MIHAREDGALYFQGQFFEKALYDFGNTRLLAQTDGCGALSRFAVADRYNVFLPDSYYAHCSIDDMAVSAHCEKTVSMLGRRQQVRIFECGAGVVWDTFLEECRATVFQRMEISNSNAQPLDFRLDFGMLLNTRDMAAFGQQAPFEHVKIAQQENGLYMQAAPGVGVYLACTSDVIVREVEYQGVHLSIQIRMPASETFCLPLAFHWREEAAIEKDFCSRLLAGIDQAYDDAKAYEHWLLDNASGETVLEKAQFCASLNCALTNYKITDGFEGFFAGVNYQSPARTYYRDSFFTVLPLIRLRPELVRKQLIALTGGITEGGTCPSAVKSEGVFWPNHLDSPQYFILLLHAYVSLTGDHAFLSESVRGRTMLHWARLLADALLERADHNHLLYRQAGNRHDWADNVFREGYVCYEQALYCQAVRSMGLMLKMCGKDQANEYITQSDLIAEAIESHLWLEEKGWYADYRSSEHLEDHLAIDTVLMAWFGIAKPERARRMLASMQALLETRENKTQPFEDWGVMCCWPPYKYPRHLVEKSSYPYVYHNGSDWPFWSCVYALSKRKFGMEWHYPATRWFTYGIANNWCTPVEYYNPVSGRGSLMQGWSAMGALALEKDAQDWGEIWLSNENVGVVGHWNKTIQRL